MNWQTTAGLLAILGLLIFAAWITGIYLLCNAVNAKGWHKKGDGALWFVGIFASPIVLGLYAAALPDKKLQSADPEIQQSTPKSELPSI